MDGRLIVLNYTLYITGHGSFPMWNSPLLSHFATVMTIAGSVFSGCFRIIEWISMKSILRFQW